MFMLPAAVKAVAPPPPSADGSHLVWAEEQLAAIASSVSEKEDFLALMEERLAAENVEMAALDARREQVERNIAAITEALDATIAELASLREQMDVISAYAETYGATS